MAYQFPPDLDVRVKAFLEEDRFETEDDVLREALTILERQREETGINYLVIQGGDPTALENFAKEIVQPLT